MSQKKIISLALFCAISVFMGVNWFDLKIIDIPRPLAAITDDYWKGSTDQKIDQIQKDIATIKNDIKDICRDVTQVQVDAARKGGLYGGGAGIGIYILGLLVQILRKKK